MKVYKIIKPKRQWGTGKTFGFANVDLPRNVKKAILWFKEEQAKVNGGTDHAPGRIIETALYKAFPEIRDKVKQLNREDTNDRKYMDIKD